MRGQNHGSEDVRVELVNRKIMSAELLGAESWDVIDAQKLRSSIFGFCIDSQAQKLTCTPRAIAHQVHQLTSISSRDRIQ